MEAKWFLVQAVARDKLQRCFEELVAAISWSKRRRTGTWVWLKEDSHYGRPFEIAKATLAQSTTETTLPEPYTAKYASIFESIAFARRSMEQLKIRGDIRICLDGAIVERSWIQGTILGAFITTLWSNTVRSRKKLVLVEGSLWEGGDNLNATFGA